MAESADHRRSGAMPARSGVPQPRRELAVVPAEPWCSLVPGPRAVPPLERMSR